MKKQRIFTWSRLIRIVLMIGVVYGATLSYRYLHSSFNQNTAMTNQQVSRTLPKLKRTNQKLKQQKRNVYNERLIVKYHYRKAFAAKHSNDKTLKKWINQYNRVDDKLNLVSARLQHNQKQLKQADQKLITKTELRNSQSNLKLIILILLITVLFFIWSV